MVHSDNNSNNNNYNGNESVKHIELKLKRESTISPGSIRNCDRNASSKSMSVKQNGKADKRRVE